MADLLKEQQAQIAERDETIAVMRNKENVEMSKAQLEEKGGTFVGMSILSNNFSPNKANPDTENPEVE